MNDEQATLQQEPDLAAGGTSLPRRHRFQFSLATLLWVMTLVACIGALWTTYRQLQQTKAELQATRVKADECLCEAGFLNVTDSGKIYARGISTEGENSWDWQLYLPERRKFRLSVSTKLIPTEAFPAVQSARNIEPGEHRISVSIQELSNGKWYYYANIDYRGGTSSEIVPLGKTHAGVETRSLAIMQSADPGARLALLRIRKQGIAKDSTGGVYDPQPCDGLMIWIEEVK